LDDSLGRFARIVVDTTPYVVACIMRFNCGSNGYEDHYDDDDSDHPFDESSSSEVATRLHIDEKSLHEGGNGGEEVDAVPSLAAAAQRKKTSSLNPSSNLTRKDRLL
jgi:hypothetical protein